MQLGCKLVALDMGDRYGSDDSDSRDYKGDPMGRPSILPDSGTLAKLRRKHRADERHPDGCASGHTLEQVAEMYGVGKSAVWKALRGAGLTEERPRYTETLPWVVSNAHAHAWEAFMLRELARHLRGEPLSKQRGDYLGPWLNELRRQNVVIDYNHEEGFKRVPRRKYERGFIRKPE